jgi:hypothetical protein
MLPRNFIEILCKGHRMILNAAHIISIEQKELLIAEGKQARAEELGMREIQLITSTLP